MPQFLVFALNVALTEIPNDFQALKLLHIFKIVLWDISMLPPAR